MLLDLGNPLLTAARAQFGAIKSTITDRNLSSDYQVDHVLGSRTIDKWNLHSDIVGNVAECYYNQELDPTKPYHYSRFDNCDLKQRQIPLLKNLITIMIGNQVTFREAQIGAKERQYFKLVVNKPQYLTFPRKI